MYLNKSVIKMFIKRDFDFSLFLVVIFLVVFFIVCLIWC